MLLRLVAAVLAVLGLAAIALGVASATVWRGDDTLTATATAADGTTLLRTTPGLLEMGDPPVTVRAEAADGTKVVLAVGRDTDVTGWLGTDAHTVVTGLRDWHTFTTDDVAATEPTPAPTETAPAEGAAPEEPAAGPDPEGSDLWIEQATGDGSAELVWTPQDGRWALLVASVGETTVPPSVELSWPRTVTTPWLLPGVVGGALLLLIALGLALRARRGPRTDDDDDLEPAGAIAGAGTTGGRDAGAASSTHAPATGRSVGATPAGSGSATAMRPGGAGAQHHPAERADGSRGTRDAADDAGRAPDAHGRTDGEDA